MIQFVLLALEVSMISILITMVVLASRFILDSVKTPLKPKFTNLTWAWIHGHTGEDGNDEVDRLLNETMDRLEAERKIKENTHK